MNGRTRRDQVGQLWRWGVVAVILWAAAVVLAAIWSAGRGA